MLHLVDSLKFTSYDLYHLPGYNRYLVFEEASEGDSECFLHCLITISINKWIQCTIEKDQVVFNVN